jgi:hypothetical protein
MLKALHEEDGITPRVFGKVSQAKALLEPITLKHCFPLATYGENIYCALPLENAKSASSDGSRSKKAHCALKIHVCEEFCVLP